MLPTEVLSAKYGSVAKKSGEYSNQRVIAIVGSGTGGCAIATLENQNGTNCLAKYFMDDTVILGPGCMVRVDGDPDKFFKKIKITSGYAVFILAKPL